MHKRTTDFFFSFYFLYIFKCLKNSPETKLTRNLISLQTNVARYMIVFHRKKHDFCGALLKTYLWFIDFPDNNTSRIP